MRFQQLNRDPNSIMRKKLVKSKKNWIVVSSLSFAGGLLLLGAPTEIVHAADTTVAPTEQVATPTSSDSKTDAAKTDSTKSTDVTTKSVAPVTTEENTDSTVQSDTVTPVEKETPTTEKTDATDTNAVSETLNKETTTHDVEETGTTSEAQPVVAKDTQTTTEDVKNINGEKVDTTQSDVNKENVIQNDGTQDDILAANLAVSKAQLASLGISAEDLTLTPEAEVLADGNIAEGTQGTTPWKVDADGVLHLGTAGETTSLADNTTTTTQHTSTGSSQIESSSTGTKESPTSPWMKHANDITRINFEGDVNAASDMSYMFADLNNLTTITNANKLHTVVSDNLSMTKTVGMFANDTNLKEISSDSTTNETKPTIDLSSWNFASVTDANSMFLNDSSIEYVKFSDDSNSTLAANKNFNYMFKNNTSLIDVDMEKLQFRRTVSMVGMFQNDRSLTTLDLGSWNMANSSSGIDTGDSSKGEGMFDGTDNLKSLTLSSINRFSSYTALSSKNGSSWTGGGKTLLSDPSKADNSTTFNLNSIVSNLGGGIISKATFSPDGNVPADIEVNLTIPSNLGDIETSIAGPIYSSQDVKVPTKDGYTANVSTITANILNDKAVTNYYVTYTPIHSNGGTAIFTLPDKTTSEVEIPAGEYGQTGVSIDVPQVTGYTSNLDKVGVTYKADGSASADTSNITYTPVKSDGGTATFTLPDKTTSDVKIPAGEYGQTGVSIDVPQVTGYTSNLDKVGVTYNADGSASADTSNITYTPVKSDGGTATFTLPDKTTSDVKIPAGEYGQTGITIDVPQVTGYTSNLDKVDVTYNADGSVSANTSNIVYTPVASNPGQKVTFTAPNGQSKTLDIPSGVYGTDGSINIPDFDGYTHTNTTVPVIYGPDGVAIVNTENLYSPVASNPDQKVTFTTPDGQSKTLDIPDGVYGTNSSITIPDFDGYTHTNTTVPVIYGPDGVATVNTKNLYTPVKSKPGQKVTFTAPDGQSETLDIPDGEYGTNDSITIPDFKGYTHTNTTVPVIYGPDGVATVNTKNLYTPVKSKPGQKVTFTAPNGQSKTLDIPDGEYGTDGSINIPDFDGYTHTNTTVHVIYGPDGVATVDTTDIYSPVKSKPGQKVTFTAPNGQSRTIDIPEGAYGTDSSITIPNIEGYTHDEKVPVSYDKDGNASVNTDKIYTPIHFDATTTTVETPEGNKTITIPEGNYGDNPKTVNVPSITGYTSNSLTVTYNADGTTSIDTPSPLYTPVHSKGGTARFTTPDGHTQTVDIPAGDFGTNGNISIPDFEGYTHEDKTIPVIYDANGNAIVKTEGLYTPIHFDSTTTTVETPEGNKTVTIPEGNYGDNPKTVNVPSITGYTSNSLTVTYNADGTTSIDTPNEIYTPIYSAGGKATFTTPNGDTTVDIPAGDFSKKGITIDVPQVTGYNTNINKVNVTYNADGSASADTKVTYTPVHSDGGTATIETPDGPVTIDIPEGDYSKSNVTTVNVPKVHGYTTNTDTLKVTYDANGNATINTSDVSYTGVENKATSINLKTPDGIVPLNIPAGHFGDEPVTITAPSISGYTVPSIIVTFGADGTPTIVDAKNPDKEISTFDTLTYSRIPSSHSNNQKEQITDTTTLTPKQNHQNVATYSEKGQILLYTLGEDNKMTAISYRGLAKQSTWYSDEQITVDGIQYLRVATNEWVKASQVYPYQDLNQYVRTYDKTAKVLYKSEDEIINNRVLQPNSSWFSDRTTYVINGDKYYRVATNEFVSAKDAYVYQPTNMVVKTHTDSPAKSLYTAKGELITNRSLIADSNWLVDSIIYIEGIKYYRVATNEFVKASDVDINH